MKRHGKVYLVGAGPGDPDLLTCKAARLIASAEAVVYDRLVSAEILALVPRSARRISVGKAPRRHPVPQSRINDILVELALEGLRVVRLKGGDPFIFGRGSEEAAALRGAGLAVEVVPGITAAQGASAASGVPLTHRGLASGVRYVTGHCRADAPLELDWAGLADDDTTLVVYMGMANLADIASQLITHGLAGRTPVLAVNNATTGGERRLVSSLSRIDRDSREAGFEGPVLFVIGRVVTLYPSCPADVLQRLAVPDMAEVAHA